MPGDCQSPADTTALVSTEEITSAVQQKRRSCDLVKTPAPCVKKALFQLGRLKELLRFALENPNLNLEQLPDHHDDNDIQNFMDKCPKDWRQPQYASPCISSWFSDSSITDSYDSEFDKESKLEIIGIGGQIKNRAEQGDSKSKVRSWFRKKNQPFPQEIFSQTHELILRLAEERKRIQLGLETENQRIDIFREKIDRMCWKRLMHLPQAVQRVYDVAAADIGELQWHVMCVKRQLETCEQSVRVEQVARIQMKQEITFVRKHCPLIEEKLNHEEGDIEKINEKLKNAHKELSDAEMELLKVEVKYRQTTATVEVERQLTRNKILAIYGLLKLLRKDLGQSMLMQGAYVKKTEECRQKLVDLEKDLTIFENRAEQAKEEERKETCKVEELELQAKQVELQTSDVMKKSAKVEIQLEQLLECIGANLGSLEMVYNTSLRKLRRIQEENKDVELDIEDINKEIATCDKAMAKYEKQIIRYKRERHRCDAMLEDACRDAESVTMTIAELNKEMCVEESKSQAAEDALKTEVESVKRRTAEEKRQGNVLHGKMKSNSRALFKRRLTIRDKKSRICDFMKQTSITCSRMEEHVAKLTTQNEIEIQKLVKLDSKVDDRKAEYDDKLRVVIAERDDLLSQENELTSFHSSLERKIEEMEQKKMEMTQQLEEMARFKIVMDKRASVAEIYVNNATDVYNGVSRRLEATKSMNRELQKQLFAATERLATLKKQHCYMVESRRNAKQKMDFCIEGEWARNKELARGHRELQSKHIDTKNKLMSLYGSKVMLEMNIKDHKQVLGILQNHGVALKQYFNDRWEFNTAKLLKFTTESEDSISTVVRVRGDLKITWSSLSDFLRVHFEATADNKVRKDAMKLLSQGDSVEAQSDVFV